MKRSYQLEELDCAVCAGKMEAGIRKIPGVIFASVNFFAQSMTLEAPDDQYDAILEKAIAVCRKIEPDCKVKLS